MKLSLHITIDTNASPALQQAVAALLAALQQESHFVTAEGGIASGFIGLEEIMAFTKQEVEPDNNKKVKADAKRFYQNLLVWTIRCHKLPLYFVYEDCRDKGLCSDGRHRHEIYAEKLPSWKLSVASVLELEEEQIGRIHPLTAKRLRRFIEYLRQLPQ